MLLRLIVWNYVRSDYVIYQVYIKVVSGSASVTHVRLRRPCVDAIVS